MEHRFNSVYASGRVLEADCNDHGLGLRRRRGDTGYLYTSTEEKTANARAAREDLIEVGCIMHARRHFVKALEANDARARRRRSY